ncbi:MAG: hypothetical protein ABW166_12375 [Sedimenticola sp.]
MRLNQLKRPFDHGQVVRTQQLLVRQKQKDGLAFTKNLAKLIESDTCFIALQHHLVKGCVEPQLIELRAE